MLDGQEAVQIACAELRWEGARQHSSRGNGLGRAQCRAVGAAFSELLARFFQDKCHHCDCPEILWTEDWSNGPKTGQTVSKGKTFVAAAGFVLHETVEK